MVTEKSNAFGKASSSLTGDWMAMQSDLMRQSQAVGAMMMSGKMPTMAAAGAMIERSTRINHKAMATGLRALRPIHAAATANQKRLSKKG